LIVLAIVLAIDNERKQAYRARRSSFAVFDDTRHVVETVSEDASVHRAAMATHTISDRRVDPSTEISLQRFSLQVAGIRQAGHHALSFRARLAIVKALASLDPPSRAAALTTNSVERTNRSYVMAGLNYVLEAGWVAMRATRLPGRLMDLRTAAAYLGCSYWTLRDLVLNGHVPAVRIPSPRCAERSSTHEIWSCSSSAGRRETRSLQPTGDNQEDKMGMLYKRGAVWWIKYYRNGRGMRESSHSRKEGDARRLLKLREGDIEHGLPVDPKLNRIRFEEAAEDLKTEYAVNGRRSADELERRIRLHLMPHFGGRRLATISTPVINTSILKRQDDIIVSGEGEDHKERRFSNGEINRELTTLKRIFNLARQNGKLTHVPHIPMLKERNVRTGFFEREQIERVLDRLPTAVRPVVQFAYITGWRIPSEVLPLQWRHIDFEARVVRLDPHTTKNDPQLPLHRRATAAPVAQKVVHDQLRSEGVLCPWVFHRTGKKVKGKRIVRFTKAWRKACEKAGCPGRIPHDLRRTAVRNLVRAGIPERVAMQMTGHKTRSVFERYNIVSECDLVEAAKKLNAIQPVPLPADSDPHGHNWGTVAHQNDSRRSVSL
jgi:integrase